MYKVLFFEINNRQPVEDFLYSLDEQVISKCLKAIGILEKYGLSAGYPFVKKIMKEIFELRIKGKTEVRFLFTYKREIFYLLHGFKKKRQKLLLKDIKIAQMRLTDI